MIFHNRETWEQETSISQVMRLFWILHEKMKLHFALLRNILMDIFTENVTQRLQFVYFFNESVVFFR